MDTFKNIPLIRGNKERESLPRSDKRFMEKWIKLKELKKMIHSKEAISTGVSTGVFKRRSKSRRSASRRSASRKSK